MKKLVCVLFLPNILAAMLYAQGVTPQAYFTEPSFAPDKAEIAFVSGGDIWSVPAVITQSDSSGFPAGPLGQTLRSG